LTRLLSGAVAIPLVSGITLYGPGWLFFTLIAVVVLAGIYEFFSMTAKMGIEGFPIVAGCLSVLLLFCFYFQDQYFLEWGGSQPDRPKFRLDAQGTKCQNRTGSNILFPFGHFVCRGAFGLFFIDPPIA